MVIFKNLELIFLIWKNHYKGDLLLLFLLLWLHILKYTKLLIFKKILKSHHKGRFH